MEPRRIDVFFYGLFMDKETLESKGVRPVDIRSAAVPGFSLRIGAQAALTPALVGRVHGLLMKLSHGDIDRLYAEPTMRAYRPEPVLALLHNGTSIAALCFNLPQAPTRDERNAEYAAKLHSLTLRLGLPSDYVASIL
jgi:hypothetical protein